VVVISSTEAAALIWPELLGQYEYDEEKKGYVQSSTEQSSKEYTARYLYKDEDDDWVVGSTPGGMTFSMWNINSTNLTTGDWLVTFNNTWYLDPSIEVTPGSLPPLPSQFIVTASSSGEFAKISGSLEYLGVFNKTERWWAGRPVYMSSQGRFLYHGLQSWMIGHKLGYHTLRGSKSYTSPADVKNWTYNEVTTYGGYSYSSSEVEKQASVTVLEATQPNLVRYKEDRKRILHQHNLKKRQNYNKSVSYSYSYDNSGIIIAVISVVVTVIGAIFSAIRCAQKYSKSEGAAAAGPSQPRQNVVPTNQVENSSGLPLPHHPTPSLQAGHDQMVRAMAPTPYSVNQSWNTRSGQPTPYSFQ